MTQTSGHKLQVRSVCMKKIEEVIFLLDCFSAIVRALICSNERMKARVVQSLCETRLRRHNVRENTFRTGI